MGNINPIGLAQEKQRERDAILTHRFDAINKKIELLIKDNEELRERIKFLESKCESC